MRTYRVSYRIVADTWPQASIVLSYVVDAKATVYAERIAYDIFEEEVRHLIGHYDDDWVKRCTVVRVK